MIAVLGVDARQQSRGQIHLAYNINNMVGLVADIGGYANTRINDRLLTYMLGPRFGWLAFAADAFRAIPVRGAYGWNESQYRLHHPKRLRHGFGRQPVWFDRRVLRGQLQPQTKSRKTCGLR